MAGKPNWRESLSPDRLELKLDDSKPLFSRAEALTEANRCLFCYDAPCIQACPTSIDIPGFIRKIATENLRGSAKTIFKANMLGVSCARVCPVEVLCAGACVYNDLDHQPIAIGRLQRYATEHGLAEEVQTGQKLFEPKPAIGRRVALIGAGPASLACAAYLALEGVTPVVYEKHLLPGGLNTTGVAPYKLHGEAALAEVEWLLNHGIELQTGVEFGKDITLEDLRQQFDAVFLGMGLGADNRLNLPGSRSAGYWGATQLIAKLKGERGFQIPSTVRHAVVIGGGNTAIDIARELAMLGVPKVTMVYRRAESDMSGYRHEMKAARIFGVRLLPNASPVSVSREKGEVCALNVTLNGSEDVAVLPCQWVVEAIGQEKQGHQLSTWLKIDAQGRVVVDPKTRQTSLTGVYAGGDCINGGKEVVNAAEDGREAAFAMLRSWGFSPSLAP